MEAAEKIQIMASLLLLKSKSDAALQFIETGRIGVQGIHFGC